MEVKLAQYADDTTAILADTDSGKRLLEMADIFTKISGLKLNKSKSYGMRLGAKTISCSDTIVGITWTETVKILGINFRANCSAAEVQENYELRLNNIEKAIAGWTRRNLSMIGKITVVKSLLTAQLNHLMLTFKFQDSILKRLNTMLHKFVWTNGKNSIEKIKRDVLIQNYENGGLKMPDLFIMQQALAASWLQKLELCENEKFTCKWSIIPKVLLSGKGPYNMLLKFNCNHKEIMKEEAYKVLPDILKELINVVYRVKDEVSVLAGNHILWKNRMITYKHKTLQYNNWIKQGIYLVEQVIDTDYNLVSFEFIKNIIPDKGELWFQYLAMKQAISNNTVIMNSNNLLLLNGESLSKVNVKKYVNALVGLRYKIPKAVFHWERKFAHPELNWQFIWKLHCRATKEPRIMTLMWKLVQNIYPTAILLKKIGKVEHNLCAYCNEVDSIEHFFYYCSVSQYLWLHLERLCNIKTSVHNVLFGINSSDTDNVLNSKIIGVGILAISKFKYGKYRNLIKLFEYECKLRNICVI